MFEKSWWVAVTLSEYGGQNRRVHWGSSVDKHMYNADGFLKNQRSCFYMFCISRYFSWIAFILKIYTKNFNCIWPCPTVLQTHPLQSLPLQQNKPSRECHLSPSFWESLMSSLVLFFLYFTLFAFFATLRLPSDKTYVWIP